MSLNLFIDLYSLAHGSFLPSSLSLLPTSRTKGMPKSSRYSKIGKLLLDTARKDESEVIAARTAIALARYQSSSFTDRDHEGSDQRGHKELTGQQGQVKATLGGGAPWACHDFDSSNLLVFARGEGEVITIRKSSIGEGWFIDYDGSVKGQPQ